MYSKFKEMLAKKRDLNPHEKHAKMSVLKDMKHDLADQTGQKFDGLKKVSVMSNSPEGLQHGLDKAKELTDPDQDSDDISKYADGGQVQSEAEKAQDSMRKAFGYSEGGEVDPSPEESEEHEASESPEFEAGEHEGSDEFAGLDMEDLKQKLRELMHERSEMAKK